MPCPKCGGPRTQAAAGKRVRWRCRPCEADYQRDHYQRNADRMREVTPRSRRGSDELSNLRWTTRTANQAKGDLLDSEFVALCAQVAEHIGRLIMGAAA